MSHTATINIDVKDPQVVTRTAQRLGYECQDNQEVRLYDGNCREGNGLFKLPGVAVPSCH